MGPLIVKRTSLLAVLTALALALSGQAIAGTEDPDSDLLAQWHGLWRGSLENLPARDGADEVVVEMEIGRGEGGGDGCLSWRSSFIVAGEVKQVKDYLMCRDQSGRFYLDEGDDLVLETSVLGGEIFSAFEAKGVMLFTHTRLDGDRIVQDIFFARDRVETVEGVASFVGIGVQRTTLSRVVRANEDAGHE